MTSNVYFVFCESLERGCWAVWLNMSVSVSVPLFLCLSNFGGHRTGNVAHFNTRAFCSISKLLGFVCVCALLFFGCVFSDYGFVSKSSTFYRTNDFCHGHKGSIASERLWSSCLAAVATSHHTAFIFTRAMHCSNVHNYLLPREVTVRSQMPPLSQIKLA